MEERPDPSPSRWNVRDHLGLALWILFGATIVGVFAYINRFVLGLDERTAAGLIAPVVTGGVAGLSVGYYFKKAKILLREQLALERSISQNLELEVKQRTHLLEQEITERKYAEESLRDNEERFRDIVESSSDWFWELDSELRYSFLSDKGYKAIGVERSGIIGKTRRQLAKERNWVADPEFLQAHLDDLENHRSIVDFEFAEIDQNGQLRYTQFNGKPIFDDSGIFQGYRGASRNITPRKLAEIEIMRRNKLVELLHRTAVDSNDSTNFNDAVKKCLDDVCQATGWPVGHAYIVQEGSDNILYSTDNWYVDDPIKFQTFRKVTEKTIFEPGVGLPGRVLESGEPAWIIDVTNDNNFPRAKEAADIGVKAGFAYPVLVRSKVVAVLEYFSEEAVEPDYMLLQILNNIGSQLGRVYEREKTSNFLNEAKLKAEEANRVKSGFLANMSHELRSPLTAIIGFSEMMRRETFGPIENEKYLDYLDSILVSGRHLSNLISDLLDISAIEEGKLGLVEQNFDVEEMVENSYSIVESRANIGKIEFSVELGTDLPTVYADERRMQQILVNLLTNAVKFTPEGGSVCLSVETAEDGSLQFTVMDTGIGMDDDGIAKALEKFGQIDSEQGRKHPGTGLGLPLTKELVEMHGGSMLIDSNPGSGTTIKVIIPEDRVITN